MSAAAAATTEPITAEAARRVKKGMPPGTSERYVGASAARHQLFALEPLMMSTATAPPFPTGIATTLTEDLEELRVALGRRRTADRLRQLAEARP